MRKSFIKSGWPWKRCLILGKDNSSYILSLPLQRVVLAERGDYAKER